MPDSAAEMAQAAETLRSAAREHKRAAEQHRRKARTLMAQLDELRAECERRGINLRITEARKESQ